MNGSTHTPESCDGRQTMNSDLYGAYSIVGRAGSNSGELHVWYRGGGKHPVTMYRLLISDYHLKSGDELMHAEDSVDCLFNRDQMQRLQEYLTRHDVFGDTHTFVRAENPRLRQLHQHAKKHGECGFELGAYDDWHNPFEVYSSQLTGVSRALGLN
jgi:hypothetical protein